MRKIICLFLMGFVLSNGLFAQAKTRADSELIRDFKNTVKNGDFLEFREKAEALKPIQKETLAQHGVYKDLIEVVKNESNTGIMREIAIEILLYFKSESHEIQGLENEFIGILQDDNSGWYIKKVIYARLPIVFSGNNDKINMEKLKLALLKELGRKIKASEPNNHINDLKRTVFSVLEQVGIKYEQVKATIESEMKETKSELSSSILSFLSDYAVTHPDFTESEVKNYCRSIFRNASSDYTNLEICYAIKLYSFLLANEVPFHIQGSDEEIFFKFLKNDNDQIIKVAAKALCKIRSTSAVEKLVERLQEVKGKGDDVIIALIESLVYMEVNLLYNTKTPLSPSLKKAALTLIRDKLTTFAVNPLSKGKLQEKLLDGLNYFGIDNNVASDYLDLETIKKLVTFLATVTEEPTKIKVGKILGDFTGQNFGVDDVMWVRWIKEEEKSPIRKFK